MTIPVLALAAAVQLPGPPPPVVSVRAPHAGPSARETLVTWAMGEMLCGGEPVAPVRAVRPYPGVGFGSDEVRLAFRIAADGRPLGIEGGPEYGAASDLAPALAAMRFAPGGRADCTVTWRATRTPVEQVPVADAMAYTIFPAARPSRAVWDRVKPAGATCAAPPPRLRNRAFPDFEAIPQASGTTAWSMVGHDIDARGRPVSVRVVAGSGNAALDRASVQAVAASRFWPGEARTGCLYPYWRRGKALEASVPPAPAEMRPAGATCPADLDWDRKPVLAYPEAFRRRSIEGWALIGFDVAPWGQTGNVRVLAAEPAATFGEYGMRTIRSAAKAPSTTGHVGCVERVRFVMGEGANAPAEPPPPF